MITNFSFIPNQTHSTRKVKRCIKRNPLKNIRVMSKLNPYARALKQIRKKELADRLKAKKTSIEKAKKLHKAMKEAKKKRKAAGGLKKDDKKVAKKAAVGKVAGAKKVPATKK